MIYELRIYHATPGHLPALVRRFETLTLKFFDKHGIRHLGFWTTYAGENSNDLYYLLEWDDLAERQTRWDAFASDPEWVRARAETETNGPLYTHITNTFLKPTGFSKMK
ncbi:MAG: NIPSNAP family protein [Chloroflexi bacterium]|nr:NIPSNAP family protein [Chloroflexota bacterium]